MKNHKAFSANTHTATLAVVEQAFNNTSNVDIKQVAWFESMEEAIKQKQGEAGFL